MSDQKCTRAIVTVTVAVAVFAGLSYWFRDKLYDEYELWTASADHLKTLQLLGRISKGTDIIETTVTRLQALSREQRASSKAEVAQLSSDLDFIYGELDTVRGNENIKAKRKGLVARVHGLTQLVETWKM
jgi:hypothetical protein